MKRTFGIVLILAGLMMLTACGEQEGLQDGYYTAQAADFNFGWKEYITIMVYGSSSATASFLSTSALGEFLKYFNKVFVIVVLGRPERRASSS